MKTNLRGHFRLIAFEFALAGINAAWFIFCLSTGSWWGLLNLGLAVLCYHWGMRRCEAVTRFAIEFAAGATQDVLFQQLHKWADSLKEREAK